MVALILALLAAVTAAVTAAPSRHVQASLVTEADAIVPGRPLLAGIRLRMDPGWHTYWRNPGDSGLPTRIRWQLPAGFGAGEPRWPYPERFAGGPVVSYGYAEEVLLPVEVSVPASVAGRVRLAARVDWLECREACLPGRAEVELSLPVRASAGPGPAAPLFAATARRLPVRSADWRLGAGVEPGSLRLRIRPPSGTELRQAYLFAVTPRLIDHSRPQVLEGSGPERRLVLPRDPNGLASPERLLGVLVAETARETVALEVDVSLNEQEKAR
jgi:thiol:disulfide interchange protein DsbD